MKKTLVFIYNWLVLSSTDETKFSATVKGSVAFSVVSVIAMVFHINGLSDVADHGVSFVVQTGKFLTAFYTFYGAFRKVNRTLAGTHAGLNSLA